MCSVMNFAPARVSITIMRSIIQFHFLFRNLFFLHMRAADYSVRREIAHWVGQGPIIRAVASAFNFYFMFFRSALKLN